MGRYENDLARLDFESDKIYWEKRLRKAISSNDIAKITELEKEGVECGYITQKNEQ